MARKGKIFIGAFVKPELAGRIDALVAKNNSTRSAMITRLLLIATKDVKIQPENKSVEQSDKKV